MSKERIVAIIHWEVYPGKEEEFIKNWQIDSDVIQTYPGALGTKLLPPADGSKIYAGYARWESLKHRIEAMKRKAKEHPELEKIDEGIAEFKDISFHQDEPIATSKPPLD